MIWHGMVVWCFRSCQPAILNMCFPSHGPRCSLGLTIMNTFQAEGERKGTSFPLKKIAQNLNTTFLLIFYFPQLRPWTILFAREGWKFIHWSCAQWKALLLKMKGILDMKNNYQLMPHRSIFLLSNGMAGFVL